MDEDTRCSGCGSDHDLYCPRCLGEGLNNHAQAHHILQTQLSASKSRCEKILYGHLPSSSSSTSSVAASTNPTPTVSSLSTSSRSSASVQASTSTLTPALRPSPPYSRLSGFLSPPPFSPPRPVSTNPSSEANSTPSGLIHHRKLSSTNSRLSTQCRDLEAELDRVRTRNKGKQESLREKRARVAKRRANLRKSQEEEDKISFPSRPQDVSTRYELDSDLINSLRTRIEAQRREDQLVQAEIRAARKVLVKEVVDVFGVRPCRPLNRKEVSSVDGPRAGKGDGNEFGREEWDMKIAGLRFPSPGGFTGYHSNHLNAILMHTLHLLHLLSTYLTTRLPFSWAWSESPGNSTSSLPFSTAGFAVYPAEEGGRMVGRPVFSAGEGLAFGRAVSVRRAEKRKEQARPTTGSRLGDVEDRKNDDAVFEEDEEDEAEEDTDGHNDPDEEESWADTEDLRLWKKRAVLYVSTSREKWKRRQNAVHPSAGVGRVDRDGHPDRLQPEARSYHQHGQDQQQPKQPGEKDRDGPEDKPEKQPKRDKYQVKEDQMILGYAMLCYDVACLGWMNGVNLELKTSRSHLGPRQGGNEEEEVDWDKVLNPLRVIEEMVRSERLGELSHTPSIPLSTSNLPSKFLSEHPVSDPSISYIPLPFSFSQLLDRATQAFDSHNQEGRTTETGRGEEDLGGDDWDLV